MFMFQLTGKRGRPRSCAPTSFPEAETIHWYIWLIKKPTKNRMEVFVVKRVVSIFMVLLLCFVLAVPALAAERYDFFSIPAVYSDFGRFSDAGGFFCESVLSPGTYQMTVLLFDDLLSSDPFVLEWSDTFLNYPACYVDLVFETPDYGMEVFPCIFVIEDSYTLFFFLDEDGNAFDLISGVDTFVINSASGGFASVVTPDLMQGVWDQVISLLPVVLTVIVGCIGLRKAIAFLLDLMRSS